MGGTVVGIKLVYGGARAPQVCSQALSLPCSLLVPVLQASSPLRHRVFILLPPALMFSGFPNLSSSSLP